jgi:hypothetical protein
MSTSKLNELTHGLTRRRIYPKFETWIPDQERVFAIPQENFEEIVSLHPPRNFAIPLVACGHLDLYLFSKPTRGIVEIHPRYEEKGISLGHLDNQKNRH